MSTKLPNINIERSYQNHINGYICGIDEVGRGCLAGPVVAAARIIPSGKTDMTDEVLKVAFDGDAVIFSEESQSIFDSKGLKGLENEPERGKRCTECFDMRFERSALYASENDFAVYATTLGISRWKDMNQINDSGHRAAERYSKVSYWDFNWRKKGGSSRMIEISKREEFYQQEYCGCVYSLRDTNKWRKENNRPRIQRGIKFYNL